MGDGYEKVCIRSGVDMKKLIYLKYMCVFVDVNIHEQENRCTSKPGMGSD